jgi:alginate O-acetyltransferase complex protein AlgI
MNAYWPSDVVNVSLIAGLLLSAPVLALALSHLGSRWAAWLFVVGTVAAVDRLSAVEPAGFRMVVLCVALWLSCKAVVGVETRRAGHALPAFWPWVGFALLWMGMRPAVFAAPRRPRGDAAILIVRGTRWFLAGLALLFLARWVWSTFTHLDENARLILASAVALPALSMMLHFGLINIAAGLWRRIGFDCRPLFRAPLRSQSLAEFWGQRWNAAFTELLTLAIYRPLRRLGPGVATLAVFFMSGLIHEAAISVPVRVGYGLPTLYFILHGCLVLLERRLGIGGRAWTLAWLALPLPMLFHPWFLAGTVWPLLGIDSVGTACR